MENLGQNPRKIYGTVHGPGSLADQGVGGNFVSSVPLSNGYHLYTAAWQQDRVVFFIDGIQYAVVSKDSYPFGQSWAFNQKMFLIINLAVGGEWPGPPSQTTNFPAKLLVDSVEVSS